ncbi:GFA family protein [Sphingomonas fennica]|nr:GFA family protein [Sphingomonas fennica]
MGQTATMPEAAPTPITGSCHCGAVTLTVPHAPEWVNSCNCSLCRRTGALMAYYPDGAVKVTGETRAYVWGDRTIGIHHCPVCGCLTHWRTLGEDFGKMGMNARLLDGFDPDAVEVRKVDGASW